MQSTPSKHTLIYKETKIQLFYCKMAFLGNKKVFFPKMTTDSKKVHKFACFFRKKIENNLRVIQ